MSFKVADDILVALLLALKIALALVTQLLHLMHQLVYLVTKLLNLQTHLLVAVLAYLESALEGRFCFLVVQFCLLSSHLELVSATLLQLGYLKLSSVTSKCSLLQGSLCLRILATIVLILQVKLLLKLIDFDLQLNPAFALKVVGLEQIHLQRVTFLAHRFPFLSQFRLCLLGLKQLHLQLAYFFLQKADSIAQNGLSPCLVLRALG